MDTKAIEEHIRGILIALGDDPDREGLKDTPKRVAKMYEEVFAGMAYSNHDIAEMFGKTFEEDGASGEQVVVMKDIAFFSHCEHHMALMYDMKATVAYIPRGRVIGLSKIARVCDMVGRRLQLQERIGSDIAQIMQIKSRMPHQNIPQKYLDDLHTLLYADDYDEDAIKQELAEKKLSSYAASVFQTMTDKTGLTEGFMPIPAKKGRKSKEILKFVK